jgi:hypothetical protein
MAGISLVYYLILGLMLQWTLGDIVLKHRYVRFKERHKESWSPSSGKGDVPLAPVASQSDHTSRIPSFVPESQSNTLGRCALDLFFVQAFKSNVDLFS